MTPLEYEQRLAQARDEVHRLRFELEAAQAIILKKEETIQEQLGRLLQYTNQKD